MVKTVMLIVLTAGVSVLLTTLILYFFAFRNFFDFMREERMKFHAEMDANMKEIIAEIDNKSNEDDSTNLIQDKKEDDIYEKDE